MKKLIKQMKKLSINNNYKSKNSKVSKLHKINCHFFKNCKSNKNIITNIELQKKLSLQFICNEIKKQFDQFYTDDTNNIYQLQLTVINKLNNQIIENIKVQK